MSSFDTKSLAEALPAANSKQTPQEHGWVDKTAYDYATYNKTNKDINDAAESGEATPEGENDFPEPEAWAGNASVYEWDDEYGDVGPRHPELEQMLFGAERVRRGNAIDLYIPISSCSLLCD